MLGNLSAFSFLRSWKLICCPTTCLLNSNCTSVSLSAHITPNESLCRISCCLSIAFILATAFRSHNELTHHAILVFVLFCFCLFVCLFVCFFFLKQSPELRLTFLIGWTFYSHLLFDYQLGGRLKKTIGFLQAFPLPSPRAPEFPLLFPFYE